MKKTRTLPLGVMGICLLLSACTKPTPPSTTGQSNLNSSSNLTYASSIGIGSGSTYYDLSDSRDLVVPCDYYSNGHANQLICYRPGTGTIWIMDNTAPGSPNPNFLCRFHSNGGIGPAGHNYNLDDSRDRIVPYDMDGTGKLNYLICYRPGGGAFWIFKLTPNLNDNTAQQVTWVYTSSIGVGTSGDHYDLSDSRDVIVPYDYYGTGHASQLICYRPGTGTIWIMKNTNPVGQYPIFEHVFQSNHGIGNYPIDYFDLSENVDEVLPYNVDGPGGLICYRPGGGSFWTIYHSNVNGTDYFQPQYQGNSGVVDASGTSTNGLKFDLSESVDRIIPYDYYSNGQTNNMVCYRPGGGVCYMFTGYAQQLVYKHTNGIGAGSTYFDLSNSNDKVFAYDYDGTGKIDHLVAYRPGGKAIWIFNNSLVKIY